MPTQRNIIGFENGHPYILVFDKRGNQQACDEEYRNEWRWFLTIDGEYQGDFDSRSIALAHIINVS